MSVTSSQIQQRCYKMAFLLVFVVSANSMGPCHNATTVEVPLETWKGSRYVNVISNTPGVTCGWTSRHVEVTPEKKDVIYDRFVRIQNGTFREGIAVAEKVGRGHYKFSSALPNNGKVIEYEAFFLYFDVPELECHFVCSNDPLFQNGSAVFYAESRNPDAQKKHAAIIKKMAEDNGFNINGLMLMDNCNCSINVPWPFEQSECRHQTAEEYFSGTSA